MTTRSSSPESTLLHSSPSVRGPGTGAGDDTRCHVRPFTAAAGAACRRHVHHNSESISPPSLCLAPALDGGADQLLTQGYGVRPPSPNARERRCCLLTSAGMTG